MALKVGLVGVGPVGDRIVAILRERSFPVDGDLRVMATSSRTEVLAGEQVEVRKVAAEEFEGLDLVFFAGREGAKGASVQWAETAIGKGAKLIDNGGDFRMEPGVPLVVPEVNMDAVEPDHHHIANPNCSTIQMVVALAPLHRAARIKRIVVSTYQSVSGWGQAAMDELLRQAPALLEGREPECDPTILRKPIAFDVLPHIDKFLPDGSTKEEWKMVAETHKILGDDSIRITATTVRVPVLVGHAEAINIETERKLTDEQAREILGDPDQAPGVVVMDDPNTAEYAGPDERTYPTPRDVEKDEYKDAVLVGRIREDDTITNGLNLWVVADNLRKGAGLNAVQIAEEMIERGLL
ncbi:MAG: aspartate-semialdehyde dehydrogenase [Armatimonadota bacterium]